MAQINRNNIYQHLLEKQFNYLDRTIQDALLDKSWLTDWYLTQEQADDFKKYSVKLIKRVFKCNTNKAKSTFDWFSLNHGLKIKEL
jgi:hypothetical protein